MERFYQEREERGGVRGAAKSGAVTVVQRTSSDMGLNPHLHVVFLDGAYHEFERIIEGIILEARSLDARLSRSADIVVDDQGKGPAYAVSMPEQRRRIVDAARLSGLARLSTSGKAA